jgi:uncharacterized protein (DUF736 family)
MANIGTFTNTENGFVGEIVTLTFRARNVRFIRRVQPIAATHSANFSAGV